MPERCQSLVGTQLRHLRRGHAGCCAVGGCCRVAPSHIRALRRRLDDDHGGGFGQGLDDDRPMAMAAADPGEDSDSAQDAATTPSVEAVGPDAAEGVADAGVAAASSDAHEGSGSGEQASADDREGEGARRRKRPRSRRSRKPADRRDRATAEAGDEPRDPGAAQEADASSAGAQDAVGLATRGGRSGGDSGDQVEAKSPRRRRGGQKAGGGAVRCGH